MAVAKDSASAPRSGVQGRSVAQHVSPAAISMPAVPVLAEQTEHAEGEQNALQAKAYASGASAPPAANDPDDSPRGAPTTQFQTGDAGRSSVPAPKENRTGLPDNLKTGVEQLSGYDLSDVKVHYNSSEPARMQAHAFAQGTDIHVAPSQEKHLAHEAWHVVQQKQGRVKPTVQMKQGIPVNDDEGLEKEADEMGDKALQTAPVQRFDPSKHRISGAGNAVQRKVSFISQPPLAPSEMTLNEIAPLNQSEPVNAVIRTWIGDNEERQFRDQVQVIKAASENVHKASFDGSLRSLADELNANSLAGVKLLSDDALWDILKRAFDANWFKAKSVLAMGRWPGSVPPPHPPHEECIELMEAMVEMRSRKWDEYYKKYLPIARQELHDNNLEIPPPDGSQSVTSDIDLSVKGSQSEAAVEFFNTNFKTEFGVPFEPGTVFDINMYSMDWMHGGDETITGEKGDRTSTITPKKEQNLEDVDLAGLTARADNQEVWSYVKIMRNLTTGEISSYKTQTLAAFTPGTEKFISMSKKLDEAETNTRVFKEKVAEKAAQMSANFDADIARKGIRSGASSAFTGEQGHDSEAHYKQDALNMAASNAIYQELIREVKKIRERIKIVKDGANDTEGKSIEALATLLANKIAEALTYANEVYASEGGVLHTVYGKQKGKKKKEAYAKDETTKDIRTVNTVLDKKQYIQSVNENVGDSVHSLNHFSHMPQYAVFRSGKYLDRLIEATDLLDETTASTFTNYNRLKEIGTTAAKEKDGAIGKDPLAANTHTLFGGYDPGKVSELKQQILAFGAEATSHFNRSN
jgi:hypothetical protein